MFMVANMPVQWCVSVFNEIVYERNGIKKRSAFSFFYFMHQLCSHVDLQGMTAVPLKNS
jgi:hypothetical protein